MIGETARLFSQPRLAQHFAIGRLGSWGALNADCVRQAADVGGLGVRLCDEPSLQLVVGFHSNIDVRIGGSALHVAAILRRVWLEGCGLRSKRF
jgi:hypothetical protein